MTEKVVPLRALTAVALCDGHDAAIVAVNRALRHRGFEVIYLGFHKSPRAIVRAGVQEDVDVIGLSSYNGGHLEFVEDVMKIQREYGVDIPVVMGGGGTITAADEPDLRAAGVARIFAPGMTLDAMAEEVRALCRNHRHERAALGAVTESALDGNAVALATCLSRIELGEHAAELRHPSPPPFVVGICGPGGAGKSTLLDELVLRFVREGKGSPAVLCSDPTNSGSRELGTGGGALLGDRIRLLCSDREEVFIRSLATRSHGGGISEASEAMVRFLRQSNRPVVFVESAGIGQADDPFGKSVDLTIYVLTAEFGSALQLEKNVMLELADVVVLNKADQPNAKAAFTTLKSRLRGRQQQGAALLMASAASHLDKGVDEVYAEVCARMEKFRATPVLREVGV